MSDGSVLDLGVKVGVVEDRRMMMRYIYCIGYMVYEAEEVLTIYSVYWCGVVVVVGRLCCDVCGERVVLVLVGIIYLCGVSMFCLLGLWTKWWGCYKK